MSLFGIYAQGMTESWKMEKALIALVAAESERHTSENIKSGRTMPQDYWAQGQ